MDKILKPRPYQEAAINFIYERDRSMVLAPVGAGKTMITLTAMREFMVNGVVKRWLVVAPKRVCTDVWPVEAPKWAPDLTIAVAVGNAAKRRAAFASDAAVVVVNYDVLDAVGDDFAKFDGIVFDELTRLKNPSGKRFKALHKHLGRFNVRIGLTGSFTSNGLEDVFGQCFVIDQTLLGRAKGAFMQQYFNLINREFNQWEPRPGALAHVMARIKPATFVLEPGEYKDTLPPCHIVEMRSDLEDRSHYEKMKREMLIELEGQEITALSAAALTTKLQQLAGGWAYATINWPDTGRGRLAQKIASWYSWHRFEMLDEILEGNQQDNTIVVYNFVEELTQLKNRYPHVWTLDDGADVIERWNRGEIRLLAVHPKSAQFGLNLQFGGCKMIFMSLPWSFTDYEQVIGRLHRSGQTREVWVYLLITNNTIDEKILTALRDKRSLAELAMEELKCAT